MMNYVRDMLIVMLEWYVGMENDFEVTAGKFGKYLKKYCNLFFFSINFFLFCDIMGI